MFLLPEFHTAAVVAAAKRWPPIYPFEPILSCVRLLEFTTQAVYRETQDHHEQTYNKSDDQEEQAEGLKVGTLDNKAITEFSLC